MEQKVVKIPEGVTNLKQYQKQLERAAKLKEQAAAAEKKAAEMADKAKERAAKKAEADKAKALKRGKFLEGLLKRQAIQEAKLAKTVEMVAAEKARIAKLNGVEQTAEQPA